MNYSEIVNHILRNVSEIKHDSDNYEVDYLLVE